MALLRNKKYKGIDCNCWKIIKVDQDLISGKMIVRLGLYQNKNQRLANVNNYLDILAKTITGVDLTRKDIYSLLKERIYQENPMTREKEQVNEFVNATDDL